MANDLTGNPWILDSTGVVTTEDIYVDKIVWVVGTDGVADDRALLLDNNNDIKFEAFASGKNQTHERDFSGGCLSTKLHKGLNVSVLGRGKLHIHYA